MRTVKDLACAVSHSTAEQHGVGLSTEIVGSIVADFLEGFIQDQSGGTILPARFVDALALLTHIAREETRS